MAFRSCTSHPDLFDSFLATPPRNEVLRELATLLDWDDLRAVVAPAYKSAGAGAPGYDPVVLIKLHLLQRLYGLSDPAVVEEAADRLSFREFLGLRASDVVPDDTTLVKFRRRLREGGLIDALLVAVERQLADQGITIREGAIKIIDATLIRAAVNPPRKGRGKGAKAPLDGDADFTLKGNKPHYGYKLHVAQDRETGLLAMHVVTAASTHDSQVFDDLIDGSEGEVLADKAYDSRKNRAKLKANQTKVSIMKKAVRGKPLSPWWRGRNKSIGRVRGFIEGSFATFKRYLGCGRARYRGLERVYEQMTWGVLAFNLRRAAALRRHHRVPT